MKKNISLLILAISLLVLNGCAENKIPLVSKTHADDWLTKSSENFHGKKVLTVGTASCQTCHGQDFAGGKSGVACADCHADYPHPSSWTTAGNEASHMAYIKSHDWSMARCKTCHGDNYQGGSSGVSCFDCHTDTAGPESCNTCHGSFSSVADEPASWAPPEDLSGNSSTDFAGVGAHQGHLTDSTFTTAYAKDCRLCHVQPGAVNDAAHIEDGQAEISFGILATDSGRVTPAYDMNLATCSDVYCHGNFEFAKSASANSWIYIEDQIAGNDSTMIWTKVGEDQAACGSCHGLPPNGHLAVTNCDGCHTSVVGPDMNIIDKNKHINGKIDFP